MENAEAEQKSNKITDIFKSWTFWQKILSLVLLPTVIGFLTYYLIASEIYWFATICFVIGIIYFVVAVMLNSSDKDFEIKFPGSWLSISKHEE